MSADFWDQLRTSTPARIGLGRHGNAVSTQAMLQAGADHAAARDAVHQPLDVAALSTALEGLGLGAPHLVTSAAADRTTYLTRPDLGRRPGSTLPTGGPVDLVVVLADRLSATAVQRQAVPVLTELLPRLDRAMSVAPPVIATSARVALGDHIGEAMQAQMVLVLVGERPGLSASDSLGAYLTWAPEVGVADSARNCVSNIRPPHGLDHATAARTLAWLISGARRLGATGVQLKAGSDEIEA